MKALVKSEWFKIRHDKPFKIILISVVILMIIQIISEYHLQVEITLGQYSIAKIGQNSALLSLFIAAFVGLFTASEFQNGTIRNTLALGISRQLVYLSKMFAACVAVFAILSFVSVVNTIGNSIAFGFGDMSFVDFLLFFAWNFISQVLFHSTYAAVFTMFAFLSKSSITTVLLSVGYVIVVLATGGFFNAFPGGGLKFLLEYFPEYYMSEISDLASLSFIVKGIAVSGSYIILSSIIGSKAFLRSDIK